MKMASYKLYDHITTGFIAVYFAILLFVSGSEATHNHGVVIPFIKFNYSYLLLFLLIVGSFYVFFTRWVRIRFDIVTCILAFRVFLNAIPFLFFETTGDYIGNLIVSCFPLLLYLFYLNNPIDLKELSCILMIVGVVIALQCILAFLIITLKGYAKFDDLFYKAYFVIPVGATNTIAGILLPLLIFGDYMLNENPLRYAYDALLVIAILLCKSRTGWILCSLYLGIRCAIFLYRRARRAYAERTRSATVELLIPTGVLLLLLIAGLVVLGVSGYWHKLQELLMGFSTEGAGLDRLLSGRLDIFKKVWTYSMEHKLLFGNGVSYSLIDYQAPHNVLLQVLYENGIAGLLAFSGCLAICLLRVYRVRREHKCYGAFMRVVPFLFFNSLVEDIFLGEFMILFLTVFFSKAKQDSRDRGFFS